MRSCTCASASQHWNTSPDKEPPSQCVARKVPELCKNYQPGKTEDFNARLTRIEQIIEHAFPQYASGDLTSPPSPRDFGSFSGNLPGSSGQWNNDQAMEVDRSQDDPKSSVSSRSSSPGPGGPEPSGGMLEAGKWFGTSALGSVNSRPIIEQVRRGFLPSALSLLTSAFSFNKVPPALSGLRYRKSIPKLPISSRVLSKTAVYHLTSSQNLFRIFRRGRFRTCSLITTSPPCE